MNNALVDGRIEGVRVAANVHMVLCETRPRSVTATTVAGVFGRCGMASGLTDKQVRDIRVMYASCHDKKAVAEKFGIPEYTVYYRCKDIWVNKVAGREYDDAILTMRHLGMSNYGQIAKAVGCDKSTVRSVCKRLGIEITDEDRRRNEAESHQKNSIEQVRKLCLDRGFEYVGGYVNNMSTVEIRCVECGRTHTVTWPHLICSDHTCPHCRKDEAARAKELNEWRKAMRRRLRDIRRRSDAAERERKRRAELANHRCEWCGRLFTAKTPKQRFCSPECRDANAKARRKACDRRASEARYRRLVVVDHDITLEKLARRDGDVCQLCGKKVDWTDCETREDGTFVAGNMYPSIDHIVPVASGGKEAWDNVQLAHRVCNSMKGARTYAPWVANGCTGRP